FWQEDVNWQWKFKGKDVWLQADIGKGKWYTKLELRYVAAKDHFQIKATKDKETFTFEGKLDQKRLTVERLDPKTKEKHRLVLTMLHSNRYLWRYELCKAEQTLFSQKWQVGNTKKGVPFAVGDDGKPECIVSGGLGTMPVKYKGKTYYVCCTGCRDE